MNTTFQIVFSTILVMILFFVSRISIRVLFQLCHRLIRNNSFVYVLISLVLLPGTILHELSHACMAMIVHLKIRDIQIFPQWKNNEIKLGSVIYEKKDVFRSILVGVAPLFVGLGALWWLYSLGLYQTSSILQILAVSYLVFAISTTMFSSKQDLVDILYLIPILVLIFGVIYVFQNEFQSLLSLIEVEGVAQFMYAIRAYLTIAIGIHIGIIMISKCMLAFYKKP